MAGQMFSAGDLVALRSGGPPLRVIRVDTFPDGSARVIGKWHGHPGREEEIEVSPDDLDMMFKGRAP